MELQAQKYWHCAVRFEWQKVLEKSAGSTDSAAQRETSASCVKNAPQLFHLRKNATETQTPRPQLLVRKKTYLLLMFHKRLWEAALKDLKAKHLVFDGTRANQAVHNHLSAISELKTSTSFSWFFKIPMQCLGNTATQHEPSLLLLSYSMNSVDCLSICWWIPCWVNQDHSIRTSDGESSTTNLHA